MNQKLKLAIVFIATYALSTQANAHLGTEISVHAGFFSGFTHPLQGLDHLAAMVAVGLWSALSARRAGPELLWGPLGFANMLLLGAMLGVEGLAPPAVEPMIAVSLLVLGLLVISRLRLPAGGAAALVGGFALFHGVAHGLELSNSAHAFEVLAGLLCATLLLHASGLGLGWALRRSPLWLPRAVGAAVALLGGALLLQLA